jgi:hypothetical protein
MPRDCAPIASFVAPVSYLAAKLWRLELPSPFSAYAPESLECSVRDDVAEGSEDVEGRPSLEGADIAMSLRLSYLAR